MRRYILSACLATTIYTGVTAAQEPVSYVYVAENFPTSTATSPISVYAASSEGKLTEITGSPFKQTAGMMAGTNGSHFITLDPPFTTTDQYLHVYDVEPNGTIGKEVSKLDLHAWCAEDLSAEFDHTGQDVYILEDLECGGGYLSFELSKSGELTFTGSVPRHNVFPFYTLPVFSGNDKFAYTADSNSGCPASTFLGMGRESSGALENISFSTTNPLPPPGGFQAFPLLVTDDPTIHLAILVFFQAGLCGDAGQQYGLASYTVQSNGDLVSTNTWENMPQFAAGLYPGYGAGLKMNAAGNILAVAVGTGIQFFHFNGADPITTFTGIIGKSGFISTMAWDGDDHLYALNAKSGKLHVYTATAKGVIEAPGSPYLPPNSCASGCQQTLIVRRIPKSSDRRPSGGNADAVASVRR